jgi:DNA replication protein DnaC
VTYNIRTDFLSDDDAKRLAERFPHLGLDVGPYDYCPTCEKTGTYTWRGVDHVCDCILQLQLHKHYCNSGIGIQYQRVGWDDWFGEPDLKAFAQNEYLGKSYYKDGTGLFLWGEMGTGKTMLANLILKDLIKSGKRCYAITVEQMIDEFTEGWKSPEDKRWFDRKVRYSDVLLLDDLGKERNRGSLPESTINNLLRDRVQTGRVTLVTTNLDPEFLGQAYGSSSLDLLYEANLDAEFTGTSVRTLIRQRKNRERSSGEQRPIE